MAEDLEITSVSVGDRVDYRLKGVPSAGISDAYHTRNRSVFQTVPCSTCLHHGSPCWRPLPHLGHRKTFLRCLLCERLPSPCDELGLQQANLVLPPVQYRGYPSDMATIVRKHEHEKRNLKSGEATSSAASPVTSPTTETAAAGSSVSARVKPIRLVLSAKRSLDTSGATPPPTPKRIRKTEPVIDPQLLASPNSKTQEDAEKTLSTSECTDASGYKIDGIKHVGLGDITAVRGQLIYETQLCQACKDAKRKHCWRAVGTSDTFSKCLRCMRRRLGACDTPRITEKVLVQPGAAYPKKKAGASPKVKKEPISAGASLSEKITTENTGGNQPVEEPATEETVTEKPATRKAAAKKAAKEKATTEQTTISSPLPEPLDTAASKTATENTDSDKTAAESTTAVGPVAFVRKRSLLNARQGLDNYPPTLSSPPSPSSISAIRKGLSITATESNEVSREAFSAPPATTNANSATPPFDSPLQNPADASDNMDTDVPLLDKGARFSSISSIDWWKGGLSLSDDLLIQQLAELKKAKTSEIERRLKQASEAHAEKAAALEKEKFALNIRIEVMQMVAQAMQRDMKDIETRIRANDADLSQKWTECQAAKKRYNFL